MTGPLQVGARPLTIVLPCYNEAERLPLSELRAFIPQSPDIFFLFVNDGSRDGTLALLHTLREEFPEAVGVLDQPQNQGKAEAVRAGMLLAIQSGALYTGFWDSDLSTPLYELRRLLDLLISLPTVEFLLGSRVRLLGRSVTRDPMRHYSGRIFATLASLTLSLPVYDTQCGAKLFRVTPGLAALLSQPFDSRWVFDVEMLARFLHAHNGNRQAAIAKIYEEPLRQWTDVEGSKLKLQDSFLALGELARIRRTYFTT